MDSLAGASAPSTIRGDGALLSSLKPSSPLSKPFCFGFPSASRSRAVRVLAIKASSSGTNSLNPLSVSIGTATLGALLLAATAAFSRPLPARADPPPATEERFETSDATVEADAKSETESKSNPSPLSQLLDSNSDAVDALRALVYQKLEEGEDSEALEILNRLMAAQPAETEWKFLAARLHNEMGNAAESRQLFEEILAVDPLSFEVLFENAVLMDRCGEGEAVIERLEQALELAKAEQKEKEARDVRLIMAQIQFLQKKVDEALTSYEELAREDPKDYRPYFCQGVIYSLLDRNKEAREKFLKYHELSPKRFDVDAYLQTPLSRVKLFTSDDSHI